jgi:hypothetical protein
VSAFRYALLSVDVESLRWSEPLPSDVKVKELVLVRVVKA